MHKLRSKESIKEKEQEMNRKEEEGGRFKKIAVTIGTVVKDYLATVRLQELRLRALIVFYCWFAAALIYYGIALNATNISADPYFYVFLGGLLELPCYLFLWPAIVFMGRVKSLALLYLLCGLTILLLALTIVLYPNAPSGLTMFLSLAGKMAITAGFTLIWMFTIELFPTKYRTMITGQASVVARVGSILSPYINDILGEVVVWAPSAMFGTISLLASVLSLFLPETKGCSMPEGLTFKEGSGNVNQAYIPETDTHLSETPDECVSHPENPENSSTVQRGATTTKL